MKKTLVFLIIFHFNNVLSVMLKPVQVTDNEEEWPIMPMDTIVYKTVNKYYCSIDEPAVTNLILYGTNSWTFPEQDVSLKLRYPTSNIDVVSEEHFIVTGFRVVLYIDGLTSNGYITDGGIERDKIELTFTSSNITTLRYQFWVYGRWVESIPIFEAFPLRMCL